MKKGNQTEQKVEVLLQPIMEKNNFELVDVEFVKEGPNWYLRVFIDKDGGVTIDDCVLVTRALEQELDEKDPIEQAYVLEVSSPGIDRQLKKEKDFVKYAGHLVDVKLFKAQNGSKTWQGTLQGLEDGVITITLESEEEMKFDRKDVSSIRLAVVF